MDGEDKVPLEARQPLLIVDDLRVCFQTGHREVHAVNGVSLSLDSGATLGIVGESGSGKSVMARCIMGLITDAHADLSGSVLFDGTELIGARAKDLRGIWGPGIAIVFQDPLTSLNPVMKVGAQIAEAVQAHQKVSRSEMADRVVSLLDTVHVPEPLLRLRQYPHELSGGMRQRVAIAIALACNPRLLVADEPTTALDVTIQADILDLLEELKNDRGMSLILISHDLGVVGDRTDEVAVMYAGEIVEYGPTEEVFAAPRMPYTSALLAASPRLDLPPHTRLLNIDGRQPDPGELPCGCNFAPRCPRATALCRDDSPSLVSTTAGHHYFSCWHPMETHTVGEVVGERQTAGA